MKNFEDHPTVQWWCTGSTDKQSIPANLVLNADSLRELCLQAGAG